MLLEVYFGRRKLPLQRNAALRLSYTELNPLQVMEEISGYAKRLGIWKKGYHLVHLFVKFVWLHHILNHGAALPARNFATSCLSCATSALRLGT